MLDWFTVHTTALLAALGSAVALLIALSLTIGVLLKSTKLQRLSRALSRELAFGLFFGLVFGGIGGLELNRTRGEDTVIPDHRLTDLAWLFTTSFIASVIAAVLVVGAALTLSRQGNSVRKEQPA